MLELTPKERRDLRAKAHHLHPVVIVGQHGLTPRVLHEIDLALKAHGLVKVRVFSEDRSERETMLARIASELGGAPVQHLGKLLIVWRPAEEAPSATPVKRAVRKTVKPKQDPASRRVPTGRRLRGQPAQVPEPQSTSTRRRFAAPTDPNSAPRGKSAPNPRRRRRTA